MGTLGQYIACSTGSSKTAGGSSKPCVLFKEAGASDWTKVHEQSVSGCFAFCGVHGLTDGSLIVAVGNMPHYDGGNPLTQYDVGCMSYCTDGVWADVVVPAAFRGRCVYVADDDTVFIGGASAASNGLGKVWSWSPSAPTTFTEELSISSTPSGAVQPQFSSISGSSASDVWAVFGTQYDADAPGGHRRFEYYHYDGVSWSGPTYGAAISYMKQADVISATAGFTAERSYLSSGNIYAGGLTAGAWVPVDIGGTANQIFSAAALSNGTGIFTGGSGTNRFRAKYDGATLSSVATTYDDSPIVRVGPTRENLLFLDLSYGNGDSWWSVSTDAGDTWSSLVALVDGSAVAYYHALDCFIAEPYKGGPTDRAGFSLTALSVEFLPSDAKPVGTKREA